MMELLEAQALSRPEKAALVADDGRAYSYAELAALVRSLRSRLAAAGLAAGGRVAVLAGTSVEQVALFLACRASGVTLCPLNWRLSAAELSAILDDFRPGLLLHDTAFGGAAECLGGAARYRRVTLDAVLSELGPEAPAAPEPDVEAIALVLYTSGTTGRPKGAMLSNRMLLANADQTARGWGLDASDSTVNFAPLFHTGGWNVLLLPLLFLGGTVTLLPRFDPAAIAALLRKGRATVLFGVPTMFQALLDEDLSGARLKFMISGGAPCPEPLLREYLRRGVTFKQGFGMTEVGPNCFRFPDAEIRRKAGAVGLPMPGTEMRLLDAEGRPADAGELWIRGPHAFSGYLGMPRETAAALQDGWVRTGDLAARDADGFYRVLGRAKDMYISGGENVYPAEIETLLHAHPAVLEAAVVGVPDPRWGEVGRAFVVPRAEASPSPEELLSFLDGKLARYKRPRDFRFLEALPKNVMGKVLKSELRRL